MLQVSVRRFAAPLDLSFKLQVTLKNYDEVIRSKLIKIEAGISEVTLSAPIHITDVSVSVFDNFGELADQLSVQFLQGTVFGLSMLGEIDKLPPLFPGNPKSQDLESRASNSYDGVRRAVYRRPFWRSRLASKTGN